MGSDLARDAAAYFEHLREAGIEPDDRTRWSFMFESDEIEPLEELGQFLGTRLGEFFYVLLQDSLDEMHEDGSVSEGRPLLRFEFVGLIDEPMLAGMHEILESLAVQYGVSYRGCSSYSEFPFDLDMFRAALSDEGLPEFNIEAE